MDKIMLYEGIDVISSDLKWVEKDATDIKQLLELMASAESNSENKANHTVLCMIIERLESLIDDNIKDLLKSMERLNKIADEVLIEQPKNKATRKPRKVTNKQTGKKNNSEVVDLLDHTSKVAAAANS